MTLQNLYEARKRCLNVMEDLNKRANDEGRLMTSDENQQWDAAMKDFDQYTNEIQRKEEFETLMTVDAPEIQARDLAQQAVNAAKQPNKPSYTDIFWRYIKHGGQELTREQRDLLRQFETRATNTITTTTAGTTFGGYNIPEEFSGELYTSMKAFGGMLQAGRIWNSVRGGVMNWPTLDDTSASGEWLTEGNAITVNDMTFSRKQFNAYTVGTLAKLSIEFLQDEDVSFVQSELAGLFGNRLGRTLNEAFTTGNGSGKPTGFVTDAASGVVAASGSLTRDNLVDLIHSVDPAYRRGPSVAFMMNDSTLANIKKLAFGSADDRPLWQVSIREGEPDRLEGFPYVINQDMASIGTGNVSVAFGDWSKYIIRQVATPSLIRLDERYMDALTVGFIMYARYDGKLIDTAAIKELHHA